ncbi:hypothetical protein [Dolichospermum flos-aquae]|uniref:Uncharacterized protein n=1 Tax=Dolichospermum flos-aquae LEGE 04289 TaxID=1828708 RepID=A0ACC5PY94_DOLFA|nr:hypothetical protein [Dolichospermum flos-aquae]MBE9217594.1 hypothetical protein [Dolichospermum flos-aquae LEGE 04289]
MTGATPRGQVTGATPRGQGTGYRLQVTGYRLQVTGYRLQVLGNFTFRYLCWFFSVHLLVLFYLFSQFFKQFRQHDVRKYKTIGIAKA